MMISTRYDLVFGRLRIEAIFNNDNHYITINSFMVFNIFAKEDIFCKVNMNTKNKHKKVINMQRFLHTT